MEKVVPACRAHSRNANGANIKKIFELSPSTEAIPFDAIGKPFGPFRWTL